MTDRERKKKKKIYRVSIDYSIVVNDLDVVEERLNEIVEENQLRQVEPIHVEPILMKKIIICLDCNVS